MSRNLKVCVAKFLTETDDALLVELPDGREIWLPWSEVSEVHRTKDAWVKVASSLAEQEKLI